MKLATRIDGPLAVIGDVHGQTDKLRDVLHKLEALPGFDERWVVFLGDFVDRGPDSAGCVEDVLELMDRHPKTTSVMGNHELAMCGALNLVETFDADGWAKRWVPNYDTEDTFRSYGVAPGDLAALAEELPTDHAEFLAGLPWVVEHPSLIFVHAGLQTAQPTAMQLRILHARDFSLTKPPWLCEHALATPVVPPDCTRTIVSGHVRYDEPVFTDRRILLDTSGGTHGELTCLVQPENVLITSGPYPARPVPNPVTPKRAKRKGWLGVFGRYRE